jgi:hypothetical protein
VETLRQKHGLTVEAIVAKVLPLIKPKETNAAVPAA